MADTEVAEDGRVRPFADYLLEVRKGRSHRELSDGLRDLVAAVTETGKAGTLTYTVKIEPMKNSGDGALLVVDGIVVKLPKEARESSIFFATGDNNLVREHPRQPRLPFEALDGGKTTDAPATSEVADNG